jgi:hypothetical protein
MRTSRVTSSLLLLAAVAVPLAGCGGDDGSSASGDAGASSTTTSTLADSGGSAAAKPCGSFEAGKGGVVRTFCDGKASIKITLGGTVKTLTGGTCEESGGYYTLNFGTVIGTGFEGDRPDYFGALFPDGGGPPQAVSVHVDGLGGLIENATGSVSADKQSVHIEGSTSDKDPDPLVADATCF